MEKLSRNIEDYPEGIVLPIDKPYRWTSADVIRKVKYAAIKHFGKKNLKVGHAGTLDPLATGILLVCIGPATRRAEELQRSRKRYLAGVSFGATTPSYDLEKPIDREYPVDGVSEEALRTVLPTFLGEQDQVAPLFSAKSIDGVRAYETARKLFKQGLPVSETGILQANRITIYDINLVGFSPAKKTPDQVRGDAQSVEGDAGGVGGDVKNVGGDSLSVVPDQIGDLTPCAKKGEFAHESPENYPSVCKNGGICTQGEGKVSGSPFVDDGKGRIRVADISGYDLPTAMIDVECSKGTYIRALARDLGEALGSGAFLSSLRRIGNGGYTISDAISLDDALHLLAE